MTIGKNFHFILKAGSHEQVTSMNAFIPTWNSKLYTMVCLSCYGREYLKLCLLEEASYLQSYYVKYLKIIRNTYFSSFCFVRPASFAHATWILITFYEWMFVNVPRFVNQPYQKADGWCFPGLSLSGEQVLVMTWCSGGKNGVCCTDELLLTACWGSFRFETTGHQQSLIPKLICSLRPRPYI